jgi:hypothetical protein
MAGRSDNHGDVRGDVRSQIREFLTTTNQKTALLAVQALEAAGITAVQQLPDDPLTIVVPVANHDPQPSTLQ